MTLKFRPDFESVKLRPCRLSKRHLTNMDRVLGRYNIEQAVKTLFVLHMKTDIKIDGWCFAFSVTNGSLSKSD